MEDAELVFISVWGAGRSVDRPFCSVNDDGWRIKPKKKQNQQKQNKKTIRLWACSGSMSHDLQVWEVAQTFIDPLTPAPFPSHVRTITWEESASSGTHVTFTALLFLTNIFFLFSPPCDAYRKLLCPSHPPSIFTQASQPNQSAWGVDRGQVRRGWGGGGGGQTPPTSAQMLLNVSEWLDGRLGRVCASYQPTGQWWRGGGTEDEGDGKHWRTANVKGKVMKISSWSRGMNAEVQKQQECV